ncbi:MAG: hypothetical protein KDJ65_25250 [Anaerolineae bacterium]|nr:hypothetical protein [Anaerolineae bacterium]
MLILKCTQKAAKELGIKPGDLHSIAAEDNHTVLGDWFVNTFKIGHSKYIMFANAATLYSLLFEYKKKDLADVGALFRSLLQANLQAEGFDSHIIDTLLADYQAVTLAKTDSRSVLGSMNDLAFMYQTLIVHRSGPKIVNLNQGIYDVNRTPQLKRDGHYSIELLKERLATVQP